jgi:probable rRNA maturation factor
MKKMKVMINNLQEQTEVNSEIEEIIQQVIDRGAAKLEEISEGEVSLALVDDNYIKELNTRFRNKEESTDVLSFPLEEDKLLGDIIISLETAQRQAKEYGHSLEREVGFLTVHGFLHLLGYNHKQEDNRQQMRSREEEILADLGLER